MIFLWIQFGLSPATVIATVGLICAPAIQIGRSVKQGTDLVLGYGQAKRRELEGRHARLQEAIADLKGELGRVDATVRLTEFLRERVSADRYARYRGIVGEVNKDLTDLYRYLTEAHQEWSANSFRGQPPLQRVVLYIDDLDRCRPERVVETLEAIHLLLALPLFIVVVGVDARWLLQSLEHHHAAVLGGPDATRSGSKRQAEMTLDYLDKIFQIPYALRPMAHHSERYIRRLLEPFADPSDVSAENAKDQLHSEGDTRGGDGDYENDDHRDVESPETRDSPAGETFPDSLWMPGGAGSTSLVDLDPPGLRLRSSELNFISRLGPALPTPRAAKKFVNLYRLIRIGIPEGQLASFLGGSAGGQYQIVLVLLALIVGSPGVSTIALAAIRDNESPEGGIETLLRNLASGIWHLAMMRPRPGSFIDSLT